MSGWKIWILLSSPPNWGPRDHIFQDFVSPHPCATPRTLTQLRVGAFMSMCLHRPAPQCLLVQAECRNVCSPRLVLRLWARNAPSLTSLLSLALSPGIDSDVKRLDTSTRTYCLHCFLCMTLYAVSMLKKKKKKRRKNTQQNQSTCFGQKKKKNRGCILSVRLGNMLLPLCAFGLCVAVFRQHELLSPLEDFRGGRATPQGFGGGTDSPEPPPGSPGWYVEQD